jgi:hypothetical protein
MPHTTVCKPEVNLNYFSLLIWKAERERLETALYGASQFVLLAKCEDDEIKE